MQREVRLIYATRICKWEMAMAVAMAEALLRLGEQGRKTEGQGRRSAMAMHHGMTWDGMGWYGLTWDGIHGYGWIWGGQLGFSHGGR